MKGVLSFASLQSKNSQSPPTNKQTKLDWGEAPLPSPQSGTLKICARFNLKPEGVSLNTSGDLFIVFDEDLDRKLGELNQQETSKNQPQRFALRDFEDWVWRAPADQLLKACTQYSSPRSDQSP